MIYEVDEKKTSESSAGISYILCIFSGELTQRKYTSLAVDKNDYEACKVGDKMSLTFGSAATPESVTE